MRDSAGVRLSFAGMKLIVVVPRADDVGEWLPLLSAGRSDATPALKSMPARSRMNGPWVPSTGLAFTAP